MEIKPLFVSHMFVCVSPIFVLPSTNFSFKSEPVQPEAWDQIRSSHDEFDAKIQQVALFHLHG